MAIPPIVLAVIVGSAKILIKRRLKTRRSNEKCRLCGKKIGTLRTQCKGTKLRSTGNAVFGTAEEKNKTQWDQLKQRNSWETIAFHPWYYKEFSINAHHIIPFDAFKIKRPKKNSDATKQPKKNRIVTKQQIYSRRIGSLCAYDINHYKNAVVLPNCMSLACQLKKPLHRSGHDRKNFNYTNACIEDLNAKLTSEIQEIKTKNACHKTKNSTLLEIFNISSLSIFNKIAEFEWCLTSDGENYNPNTDPYKGCQNNTTILEGEFPPCEIVHEITHLFLENENGDLKKIDNYDLEIGK